MGGKWWINDDNEVCFKHTIYYDVYAPEDEPLCDY